jgi:predicted Zn-dependent protease with MMP-like domain
MIRDGHWHELLATAQGVVQSTLASLPEELRAAVRPLAILYQERPSTEVQADGIDADSLGLFRGDALSECAQIILYLDNICAAADGDHQQFCEEVRVTLLHEIGHFLGLDEDDLDDRGLT